jgi:hypothetical protein
MITSHFVYLYKRIIFIRSDILAQLMLSSITVNIYKCYNIWKYSHIDTFTKLKYFRIILRESYLEIIICSETVSEQFEYNKKKVLKKRIKYKCLHMTRLSPHFFAVSVEWIFTICNWRKSCTWLYMQFVYQLYFITSDPNRQWTIL